jgi:hypothetical protein
MAVGFRAVNADNIVQIDETYKNLTIIAEGTGTTGTTITFPAQTFIPLVAIGVTGVGSRWSLSSVTTSNFSLFDRSGSFSPTSFTFPYKVFGLNPNALTGNPYGLEIRDASNALIFNSNYKYFKTRYVQDVQFSNFTNASTSFPIVPMYSQTISGLTGSPYVIANGLGGIPVYKYWGTTANWGNNYEPNGPYGSYSSSFMSVGLESASMIRFYPYFQFWGGVQNKSRFQPSFKLILGY